MSGVVRCGNVVDEYKYIVLVFFVISYGYCFWIGFYFRLMDCLLKVYRS